MVELRVEIEGKKRGKGRPSLIGCRVFDGEVLVFDEAWISLRLKDVETARWLSDLICRAFIVGKFVAPAGHGAEVSQVNWVGDLEDDCTASIAGLDAHVEHLSGPRRGGMWFSAVGCAFNSVDYPGLEIRSSSAARWLCELLAHGA